jgi:hypothetical protein
MLCLLLTGCAPYSPWVEPGEPIVRPGTYKRTIKFHFYADQAQLQRAWRADDRWIKRPNEVPPLAYAYPYSNEVHTVMPTAGDPFWMCILGHEVLHELTHAPNGQWHFPVFGGTECFEYQGAE